MRIGLSFNKLYIQPTGHTVATFLVAVSGVDETKAAIARQEAAQELAALCAPPKVKASMPASISLLQ